MHQVVQNVRNGRLSVTQVPEPLVRPGHVLIQNACSVISPGTEKMVIDLASKSLIGKARARPDHVRQIIDKMRTQGIFTTIQQVFEKLNEPIGLGYSSAGYVLACGAGVQNLKPGDRVASNGPHAGVVCISKHLCAQVPDNVPLEQGAFAVMGSIALQGVRLTKLGLGDTVLVIGLGLVGQIAVKLLKAQGCRVIGTDLDPSKCQLAVQMGADRAAPGIGATEVGQLTRGIGADAVLITAATKSDVPIEMAGACVRSKGRVVVVGAVGLNMPRQPFYLKEAEVVVSCSYGPGRYDAEYEERGHDYPVGHVRWTEQRNMQAILDLMSDGKLDVSPLISHRFEIEQAAEAYEMIKEGKQPYLGVVLNFSADEQSKRVARIELKAAKPTQKLGVGCLGAGGFARMVLLPALKKAGGFHPRVLCSAGGLSATASGKIMDFDIVTADEQEVIQDPQVNVVFSITRHNLHARQVVESLKAGKHVFVEKPLAMTVEELADIERTLSEIKGEKPLVMVGFNRRFSPFATAVRDFFAPVKSPITVSIRFNAGSIPADHWTQNDLIGGGRIIGEGCHAIDLATYLTGSPVVRVFAESIGGPNAPQITDDQCFITLRHANGSISNIAYLAGGDKSYPKERVEVLGGERLAVIDDFRETLLTYRGKPKKIRGVQDKGHRAEVVAFAEALTHGGASPISWEDLRSTTLASILAVQSLREGVPLDLPGGALSLSVHPELKVA
ncbi:MAG: bi-domain-containing oxidoreductase [Planctomycetaceae bacterium]|nr:bi-domain-containing oxidoreductase [Planctomycetaceae bacterium]